MRHLILLFLFALSSPLPAIDNNPGAFASPADEARYYELIEELRCVVCQNQSLADSNAELAQDLRNEVRGMVDKGRSNAEITDFLVDRYGDFVLYNPPLKTRTLFLWLGPAIFLVIAVLIGALVVRSQRRTRDSADELSADERAKLQQVLDEKDL